MQVRRYVLLLIILASFLPGMGAPHQAAAYVEPGLLSAEQDALSVIVIAGDVVSGITLKLYTYDSTP